MCRKVLQHRADSRQVPARSKALKRRRGDLQRGRKSRPAPKLDARMIATIGQVTAFETRLAKRASLAVIGGGEFKAMASQERHEGSGGRHGEDGKPLPPLNGRSSQKVSQRGDLPGSCGSAHIAVWPLHGTDPSTVFGSEGYRTCHAAKAPGLMQGASGPGRRCVRDDRPMQTAWRRGLRRHHARRLRSSRLFSSTRSRGVRKRPNSTSRGPPCSVR